MKALFQDDNEIYLDKVVTDREAIRNNLRDRLSIIRGEYLPNVMLGLPIGAKREEIDLNVVKIITDTTGVVNVIKFNSQLIGGCYSCQFEASTVYGVVEYE